MIYDMALNDNGPERVGAFAMLRPHEFRFITVLHGAEGTAVIRLRFQETDLGPQQVFERLAGGPLVDRGPAPKIEPGLAVELGGAVPSGYLDALYRQRRGRYSALRPALSAVK